MPTQSGISTPSAISGYCGPCNVPVLHQKGPGPRPAWEGLQRLVIKATGFHSLLDLLPLSAKKKF